MAPLISVRPFHPDDGPGVWSILEPVFRAGETYSVDVDIAEDAARRLWTEAPAATFVAEDGDGALLGTHCIKANHPGPGSHVSNCGYVTGAAARGKGVATAMSEHSQGRAARLGGVRPRLGDVQAAGGLGGAHPAGRASPWRSGSGQNAPSE